MGIVFYAPGLGGYNSFRKWGEDVFEPASNEERGVRETARLLGWKFHVAAYQDEVHQSPAFSTMQDTFAIQFRRLEKQNPGSPILIVGSDVGFGVALGALAVLKSTSSPIALLGYKPIIDPLHTIEGQLGHTDPEALRDLKAGNSICIPLPAEGNENDSFLLTRSHLQDSRALRLLTDESARHTFNQGVGGHLRECIVLYDDENPQTPSDHMKQFRDAVSAVETLTIALEGGNGAAMIERVAEDMMKRLISTKISPFAP